MDVTLGYLRESLSNYTEKYESCQQIYAKLKENQYKDEGEFVNDLNEAEMAVLDLVLKNEINYAKKEQDDKRAHELSEVYELLF
ncbi:sporulation protein [Anaerobacillus alkalidiazotrophicus]|uniref:Sporulation protein n=1 Tax=Anaerobacillus alkalidiazotrophicus TaxID=472963 RepID=A0A1S2M3K7_9BACI|nr:sigma-G-dependent sporulation-specific acid-soluble spore protein CsgA [Anaerobacillus alkalidiazotrophicus]OIJ19224.1 sporulation protein [Anaerobacillus alkalidiazotrophicus]